MLLNLLNIIFSCAILAWSADKIVLSACSLAKNLNVAPIVIGLTIIALGTSAPEIIVSIFSSIENSPSLAIGNAIGSNIANIALVIGCCAILQPLRIKTGEVNQELISLIIVSFGISLLVWQCGLSWFTGSVMLLSSIIFTIWLVIKGYSSRATHNDTSLAISEEISMSLARSIVWVTIGLALLLLSAKSLVYSAVEIAHILKIPESIIGLTIVAIGTSLPELAASFAATKQKQYGIVIGNVIGSNIYNLTAVLCAPAYINQGTLLEKAILYRDIPLMLFLTLIFFLLGFANKKNKMIGRPAGTILCLIYVLYLASLIFRKTIP